MKTFQQFLEAKMTPLTFRQGMFRHLSDEAIANFVLKCVKIVVNRAKSESTKSIAEKCIVAIQHWIRNKTGEAELQQIKRAADVEAYTKDAVNRGGSSIGKPPTPGTYAAGEPWNHDNNTDAGVAETAKYAAETILYIIDALKRDEVRNARVAAYPRRAESEPARTIGAGGFSASSAANTTVAVVPEAKEDLLGDLS